MVIVNFYHISGIDIKSPIFDEGAANTQGCFANGRHLHIIDRCGECSTRITSYNVCYTKLLRYKELISLAKAANLNNIRIFGWHPPEIPEFYQYCDEMGMTVWQDIIPLGTGNIPNEEQRLVEIFNTGVEVIKARRNHPSLIMMEGGEEMLLRTRDAHFGRAFLERHGDSLKSKVDLPYA